MVIARAGGRVARRDEVDDLSRSVADFQMEILSRWIISNVEHLLFIVVVETEIDRIALAER
jgi:hypothetical protein